MRDVDAALVQQVLDVSKRQRVADIHHHREADDLRRGLEVTKNARVAHARKATAIHSNDKPIFL